MGKVKMACSLINWLKLFMIITEKRGLYSLKILNKTLSYNKLIVNII
jgi:hypothetical protein